MFRGLAFVPEAPKFVLNGTPTNDIYFKNRQLRSGFKKLHYLCIR